MNTIRIVTQQGEDGLGELWAGALPDGRMLQVRLLPGNPGVAAQTLALLQAQRLAFEPLLGAGAPRWRLCGQLEDGRVYVATEVVRGGVLAEALGSGPLARGLTLLAQLAETLARAHGHGLAHGQLTADAVQLVLPRSGQPAEPKLTVRDLGVMAALFPSRAAALPGLDAQALATLTEKLLEGAAGCAPAGSAELAELLRDLRAAAAPAPALIAKLATALRRCAQSAPAEPLPGAPGATVAALKQPETPADPLIGRLMGNFRLVRKLGEGGMGAVYQALHHRIGHPAAVKIMQPYLAHNPEYAARFLNEARAVNLATNPGLVKIFEFDQTADGMLYLVMELLTGETLRARGERSAKGVPEAEALDLIRQIAQALAIAHRHGIVHRDLKPENIMLVAGEGGRAQIKVLDFGIVKLMQPTASGQEAHTEFGSSMGTQGYMAPEQHGFAESVNDKADVFSLGVMLAELLSGQLPYVGTAATNGDWQVRSLQALVPGSRPEHARLLARMLALDPRERPSMEEVVRALAPQTAPRRRTRAGFMAAGLLVLTGSLYVMRARTPVAEPTTYAAAQAQQQERFHKAFTTLQKGLTAPDVELQRQTLGETGKTHIAGLLDPILGVLTAATARQTVADQLAALDAIGQLGSPAALPRLREILGDQPVPDAAADAALPLAAAAALYTLGVDSGRALLETALHDPRTDKKHELRARAAFYLLRARAAGQAVTTPLPELAKALQASPLFWQGSRSCAATLLLASAGEPAAQRALVALFRQNTQGPDCALRAADELFRAGALDPELIPAQRAAQQLLKEQASRPGSAAQLFAAGQLCRAGEGGPYAELLLQIARDPTIDAPARSAAVDALAACGGYAALATITPLLDDAQAPVRLAAAATVLRIVGDPEQISRQARAANLPLTAGSQSPVDAELAQLTALCETAEAESLRLSALSLARLTGQHAVAALAPRLADARTEIRATALQVLAEIYEELRSKTAADELRPLIDRLRARAHLVADQPGTATQLEYAVALSVLYQLGDRGPEAALQKLLAGSAATAVQEVIVRLLPVRSGLARQALSVALPLSVRFVVARRFVAARLLLPEAVAVLRTMALGSGGDALIAYALLRQINQATNIRPDLKQALQPGQRLTVRFDAVSALRDLPIAEVLPLLWVARADPAVVVRARAIDIVVAHLSLCPLSAARRALLDILRSLQSDAELSIRLKVARELGQWQAVEAKLCAGGPRAPGAEEKDSAAAFAEAPRPASVDLGNSAPAAAPPDLFAPADDAPDLAAAAAKAVPSVGLVDGQLNRARDLEKRGNIDEALAQLETVQERGAGILSVEQRQRIDQALARMRPNQGSVVIRKTVNGVCRKQKTLWYLPGDMAIKNPSGGSDLQVHVKRGQLVEFNLCPKRP